MNEKYATPDLYLDTDDHARLLDENPGAYASERAERVADTIEAINIALEVCETDEERRRLNDRLEQNKTELEMLREVIEHHRP